MNDNIAIMKKRTKRIIIISSSIGGVLVAGVAAFFIYVGIYQHATNDALTYLEDSTLSKVEDKNDYVTFQPKDGKSTNGFIFYPGGKVEYKAYAPLLRDLSDQGISSILVKMPFNLAVFNINGADNKQSLMPNVTSWYIGGHSLGGAMASSYLGNHAKEYNGVVLLAAYSTVDLTSSNLKTLSLLASNDKVINKDKYDSNRKNLPQLEEHTIEGGIHSYFGDYGIQGGDGSPTITVVEQRKEVVSLISSFIK